MAVEVSIIEMIMVLLLLRLHMPVTAATLPVVFFPLCMFWPGCFWGFLFLCGWLPLVSREKSRNDVQPALNQIIFSIPDAASSVR